MLKKNTNGFLSIQRRNELQSVAVEVELFEETFDANDTEWINDFWKTFTQEHTLIYRESQVWHERVLIGIARE